MRKMTKEEGFYLSVEYAGEYHPNWFLADGTYLLEVEKEYAAIELEDRYYAMAYDKNPNFIWHFSNGRMLSTKYMTFEDRLYTFEELKPIFSSDL